MSRSLFNLTTIRLFFLSLFAVPGAALGSELLDDFS